MSANCKNFVSQLLSQQSRDRLSGDKAIRHQFFESLPGIDSEIFRTESGPLISLVETASSTTEYRKLIHEKQAHIEYIELLDSAQRKDQIIT